MSKDKLYNRTPKDTKGIMSFIAHRISVARRFDGEAEAAQLHAQDFMPQDQEIVLFPQAVECIDIKLPEPQKRRP